MVLMSTCLGGCVRFQLRTGLSRVEGVYTKTEEPTVTTSSLTMEVEALAHAIQWLASQRDAQITYAIILTDSMNLLLKVEPGMGCPTGTQPCTVFGYKDFFGSTVLGLPESVEINGQIDWHSQQISHLVCSLAGQRCSEA